MPLDSMGERLVGRELVKEDWNGIPHYRPGQVGARVCPDDADLLELSWVSAKGHAVVIFTWWSAEENDYIWLPIYTEAGHIHMAQHRLPERFTLTAGMRLALDRARGVASSDTGAIV